MKLSLKPNDYLKADSLELFLFGARWSFGFWLLYLGVMKWVGGPGNFLAYIAKDFADEWPPELMITAIGWIILISEPLLGFFLILGFQQRLAWLLTAKLMFLLLMGKTILGDYATVANNWQYFFIALGAASLSPGKLRKENN
jgi:uncharacterized membrane protein YphA (DoxX/SURF4 family)